MTTKRTLTIATCEFGGETRALQSIDQPLGNCRFLRLPYGWCPTKPFSLFN
jgi:hypothetical protein